MEVRRMDFGISKTIRARGTDRARVIQVIETRAICGAGIENDPIREVIQYWSFEGELLAEHDTIEEVEG